MRIAKGVNHCNFIGFFSSALTTRTGRTVVPA